MRTPFQFTESSSKTRKQIPLEFVIQKFSSLEFSLSAYLPVHTSHCVPHGLDEYLAKNPAKPFTYRVKKRTSQIILFEVNGFGFIKPREIASRRRSVGRRVNYEFVSLAFCIFYIVWYISSSYTYAWVYGRVRGYVSAKLHARARSHGHAYVCT